jgi:hypothetical protein
MRSRFLPEKQKSTASATQQDDYENATEKTFEKARREAPV